MFIQEYRKIIMMMKIIWIKQQTLGLFHVIILHNNFIHLKNQLIEINIQKVWNKQIPLMNQQQLKDNILDKWIQN